jgi:hypothetical protein
MYCSKYYSEGITLDIPDPTYLDYMVAGNFGDRCWPSLRFRIQTLARRVSQISGLLHPSECALIDLHHNCESFRIITQVFDFNT